MMHAVVAQSMSAAIGIWLMFAPAVLGHGGAPADNDRIVGPLVASVGLIAIFEVVRGVRWMNAALGAWLTVSAFVLPYPVPGAINAAICGAALILLALPGGPRKHRYGGGWKALLRRGNGGPEER